MTRTSLHVSRALALAMTLFVALASKTSHAGWSQPSAANYKDFAVGNGLVCVAGMSSTEDVVQCFKPYATGGIGPQPFTVGWGEPYPWRVPGGILDSGSAGGTPTGVLAVFGESALGADEIAVLNDAGTLMVSYGDRNAWYSGTNYKFWQQDRLAISSTTGSSICLKGIFSWRYTFTSTFRIGALGCAGELYERADTPYRGWVRKEAPTTFADASDGWDSHLAWLTSVSAVQLHGYFGPYSPSYKTLPQLPLAAGIPLYLGYPFVIASQGTGSRFYRAADDYSGWTSPVPNTPSSDISWASFQQIQSAFRFNGKRDAFFAWQHFSRVYYWEP
jgi:hypothetical protein